MWDLDTLRYLNNQAYLANQKMINGQLDAPARPTNREPIFPLSLLAAKLITGPPSVAALLDLLGNADYVSEFLNLIREFIPDRERDIMSQITTSERIERFCHFFGNQYFPLEDVYGYAFDDFSLGDFLHHIPVQLMGFSYDDYSQFSDYRDSFVLLLSLVESPFVDNERIPILERVKEILNKGIVSLIPENGWSLEYIRKKFEGSQYQGVVAFANWIHQDTGCWQLDANYTEYGEELWSHHVVNGLTEQWPRVVEFQNQMQKMYEWLEEDMEGNFKILLDNLRGVVEPPPPKEQLPFPLDEEGQIIKEEVKAHG